MLLRVRSVGVHQRDAQGDLSGGGWLSVPVLEELRRLSQETLAVAIGLTLQTGSNGAGTTVVAGNPGNGVQAQDSAQHQCLSC